MKKQLAVFSILLSVLFSVPAFAADYSCVAPYDLSNKFGGFFTQVTGTNFLGKKAAEKILKSQIKKNADGKFKVEIDSFSTADLAAGRFKGLKIYGENVVADGVYFDTMNIKTLCDFNYITYDKKTSTAVFKEDFPMSFAMTLTESDLNNTMKAAGYDEIIQKINELGKRTSLFTLNSTKVKIKDNSFYYVFDFDIPLFRHSSMNKSYSVVLVSDLYVMNGKIKLFNPKLMNDYKNFDIGRLTALLDYLNPLEYSLEVMKDKDATVKVHNVSIVDNKINITGVLNVPKDVQTQQKD